MKNIINNIKRKVDDITHHQLLQFIVGLVSIQLINVIMSICFNLSYGGVIISSILTYCIVLLREYICSPLVSFKKISYIVYGIIVGTILVLIPAI